MTLAPPWALNTEMPERLRCPICHQECSREGNPFRPFCSERCRLVDLGNWLGERYRISGAPAGEESDDSAEAEDGGPGGKVSR